MPSFGISNWQEPPQKELQLLLWVWASMVHSCLCVICMCVLLWLGRMAMPITTKLNKKLINQSISASGQLSHFPHWKWNKRCLLLLLSGVSTISIVACWRDTKHKHCIYYRNSLKLSGTNSETHNTSTAFTVIHWKWKKQCLLSGASALWRDTQHKHCIYCHDHRRPTLDDHLYAPFK